MTLDLEIAAASAAVYEKFLSMGLTAPIARGDVQTLRTVIDAGLALSPSPPSSGVCMTTHQIPTSDGDSIQCRWYAPEGTAESAGQAAAVYLHGGGMIAGRPEHFDGVVRYYVQQSGVCFAVPEFRLSPEYPGERMARDGLDTISWLREYADRLLVDQSRIAVMGDSGGGGIAAGTAILARDSDISLAKQILIYPMLDDRNTVPDPSFPPVVSWDWDSNWTCWRAVLGDRLGGREVPAAAAPARLVDFAGLTPGYIEVGELDIFRNESIHYAQRLHAAGISCELQVLPGVTHGHDRLSVEIDVSRRSLSERCRVLAAL